MPAMSADNNLNQDYDYEEFFLRLPAGNPSDIIPELGIRRGDFERIISFRPRPKSPAQFTPEPLPRPGAPNYNAVKDRNEESERNWAQAWKIVDKDRVLWSGQVRMEILEQQKQDERRRRHEEEQARRRREEENGTSTKAGRRSVQSPVPNVIPCEACAKKQMQCMGKPGNACIFCARTKTRCSLSKSRASYKRQRPSSFSGIDSNGGTHPIAPKRFKLEDGGISVISGDDGSSIILPPILDEPAPPIPTIANFQDLAVFVRGEVSRQNTLARHALERIEMLMQEQRKVSMHLLVRMQNLQEQDELADDDEEVEEEQSP